MKRSLKHLASVGIVVLFVVLAAGSLDSDSGSSSRTGAGNAKSPRPPSTSKSQPKVDHKKLLQEKHNWLMAEGLAKLGIPASRYIGANHDLGKIFLHADVDQYDLRGMTGRQEMIKERSLKFEFRKEYLGKYALFMGTIHDINSHLDNVEVKVAHQHFAEIIFRNDFKKVNSAVNFKMKQQLLIFARFDKHGTGTMIEHEFKDAILVNQPETWGATPAQLPSLTELGPPLSVDDRWIDIRNFINKISTREAIGGTGAAFVGGQAKIISVSEAFVTEYGGNKCWAVTVKFNYYDRFKADHLVDRYEKERTFVILPDRIDLK